MATEQQNHLKQVVEQSQTLVTEINQLEGQAKSKREMLLKLQGIIEYLQQTGAVSYTHLTLPTICSV